MRGGDHHGFDVGCEVRCRPPGHSVEDARQRQEGGEPAVVAFGETHERKRQYARQARLASKERELAQHRAGTSDGKSSRTAIALAHDLDPTLDHQHEAVARAPSLMTNVPGRARRSARSDSSSPKASDGHPSSKPTAGKCTSSVNRQRLLDPA